MRVKLPRDESADEARLAHPHITYYYELDCIVKFITQHPIIYNVYTDTDCAIVQLQIMQIEELTPNGVQRLLKGETVILQIINTSRNPVERHDQKIQLITATVNDGFTYFEAVYLFPDNFPNQKIQNNVVKLKLSDGAIRKFAKGTHKGNAPQPTDSSVFSIVTNKVTKKIGNPIKFEQYMANGKKNPKGSRKIFPNGAEQAEETDDDDLQNQQEKLRQKLKEKRKVEQAKETSKAYRQSENNSRAASNNSRNNSVSVSASNTNQITQQGKQKGNPQTKPIVKTENKQEAKRTSIKPEVKHHEGPYQKINQLFLGIQNFKIVARLLFMWPIKIITNKKGTQSELLNLEFGDDSGTIMCTVFGDKASKYSTLDVDTVFGITGASVTEATYKGVTELKLNFNEGTIVTLEKAGFFSIPTIDKFCLSLKQLNETEKGRVVSVICLVKECELVQFVSKNGNNVKKKVLKMFDLENQIQSELTIFNEKAQVNYQSGMYALKGVEVDEFQGNKQFKGSLIFVGRYLKNHPMNKRMKETEQLTFVRIGSNQKGKRQSISSFYVLNEKCEQLKQGENIWSESICYLKAVRLGGSSKTAYLSCPACKKKIADENATSCEHCKKQFDKGIYRYILNVNLIDDHDNIWVSAYDDAGQTLMTLPTDSHPFTADSFVQMSEQMLRQRVQEIRYRQLKVKIVSSKQTYNNETRVKHKIVKILPIDFREEIKNLLQKITTATTM